MQDHIPLWALGSATLGFQRRNMANMILLLLLSQADDRIGFGPGAFVLIDRHYNLVFFFVCRQGRQSQQGSVVAKTKRPHLDRVIDTKASPPDRTVIQKAFRVLVSAARLVLCNCALRMTFVVLLSAGYPRSGCIGARNDPNESGPGLSVTLSFLLPPSLRPFRLLRSRKHWEESFVGVKAQPRDYEAIVVHSYTGPLHSDNTAQQDTQTEEHDDSFQEGA